MRRSDRFNTDLSFPMIFCVIEAVVLLSLITVLDLFFKTEGNKQTLLVIFVAIILFYLFSAGTICLLFALKARKIRRARHEAMLLETETYDMFRYIIDLPYAIVDSEGSVKIMNGALQDILGYKNAVSGIDFSEICNVPIKNVIANAKNKDDYLSETLFDMPREESVLGSCITLLADSRRYEVTSYIIRVRGENYYFAVFKDIEDLLSVIEREERESPVVAYILLDNLQELTQYVRADYRAASSDVENILRSWITDINGFIREYDNDKYVAVFSKQELDRQMKDDFEIQQKIMALKIGDNSFPVTISMGVSSSGSSIMEKEKEAHHALNIAIRRGGNQVAVKREDSAGYIFFGGTHKTMEKNTSIVSRVTGEILEDKIRKASNVLIMGHANPDFDSIGSCVGMARFAMSAIASDPSNTTPPEQKVNIVIDRASDALSSCLAQIKQDSVYDRILIGKDAARDLITSETVLIICDVNNPAIYESPELPKRLAILR